MAKNKALDAWSDLNARQQHYLKSIYTIDQDKERFHARDYLTRDSPPARVWRWIVYDQIQGYSPLQVAIGDQAIDQGTGSTFEALAQRGLIETRYDQWGLSVKLTTAGRAAVRAGTGKQPSRKQRGEMSKPLWNALKQAYEASETGYAYSSDEFFYGIRWLLKRKVALVVCWQDEARKSRVRATDAGCAYYEQHLALHQRLYPELYQ